MERAAVMLSVVLGIVLRVMLGIVLGVRGAVVPRILEPRREDRQSVDAAGNHGRCPEHRVVGVGTLQSHGLTPCAVAEPIVVDVAIRRLVAGEVRIAAVEAPRRGVEVAARDEGPGIADLDLVMTGNYRSKTGMGMGLRGAKRLMDTFEIDTSPTGTNVLTRKFLT